MTSLPNVLRWFYPFCGTSFLHICLFHAQLLILPLNCLINPSPFHSHISYPCHSRSSCNPRGLHSFSQTWRRLQCAQGFLLWIPSLAIGETEELPPVINWGQQICPQLLGSFCSLIPSHESSVGSHKERRKRIPPSSCVTMIPPYKKGSSGINKFFPMGNVYVEHLKLLASLRGKVHPLQKSCQLQKEKKSQEL